MQFPVIQKMKSQELLLSVVKIVLLPFFKISELSCVGFGIVSKGKFFHFLEDLIYS